VLDVIKKGNGYLIILKKRHHGERRGKKSGNMRNLFLITGKESGTDFGMHPILILPKET
jgi:hypothetical protein